MSALTRRVDRLVKSHVKEYASLQDELVRLWETRPYTYSYQDRQALDEVMDYYAARIQGDDPTLTPAARALIERFKDDPTISAHVAKLEAFAAGWKEFLYEPLTEAPAA